MTKMRSLLMLLQLAVAFLFVACVSIFMPDVFLLRLSATLVLLAFSPALMMCFDDHIIDPGTRKCLMSIAGLIVAWIILRGAKNEMDSAFSCQISFNDGGKASFGLYADRGGALPRISEEGHIRLALYLDDEILRFC